MYALHLDVPQGASAAEASLDFISPTSTTGFSSGASVTEKLAMLSWNQVLLYPKGAQSDSITCTASLRLPAGWGFGTALEEASSAGERYPRLTHIEGTPDRLSEILAAKSH